MSADPVEITHVAIAGAGFAFSLWNVFDTRADVRAVRAAGINRAAPLTAQGSFRNELLRSLQLAILVTIGVVAFFLPPSSQSSTAPRVATIGLFIVFDLLITANTAMTLFYRRRILRMLGVHRKGDA